MSPYKVGLLNLVSYCKVRPSGDETIDHAGIVAFSDMNLQAVFILYRWLDVEIIWIIDFPKHVSVVVGFKGNIESSSIASLQRRWFLFPQKLNFLLYLKLFLLFIILFLNSNVFSIGTLLFFLKVCFICEAFLLEICWGFIQRKQASTIEYFFSQTHFPHKFMAAESSRIFLFFALVESYYMIFLGSIAFHQNDLFYIQKLWLDAWLIANWNGF